MPRTRIRRVKSVARSSSATRPASSPTNTILPRRAGEILSEVLAADQLEHHVDAASLGQLHHLGREGAPGHDDGLVQTKLPCALELFWRARGADRACSARARKLHGSRADAAAGGVDENAFAHRELALADECVVRGDESFGNRGGLREGEFVRNPDHEPFVGDELVGVGSAAHETKHAVTDLPRGDARSQRADLPREFEAGNIRRHVGRWRITTAPLQDVGSIDASRANAYPDLTARRFGGRPLDQGQHLGASEFRDRDRAQWDLPWLVPSRPVGFSHVEGRPEEFLCSLGALHSRWDRRKLTPS